MRTEITLKTIVKHLLLTFYGLFVIALIAGNLVSGIFTLIPSNLIGWGATESSYLGYVSHCSFAPWSTLISFTLAVLGLFLLVRFVKNLKPKINNDSMRKYFISIALGVLFFAFPVIVIIIYVIYQLINHFKPTYSSKILDFCNNLFGLNQQQLKTK